MLKNQTTTETYVNGVLANDKILLARTITLIESTATGDRKMSDSVMAKLMPHTGQAVRIGITGVPGVGKSTFIETFGNFLIDDLDRKIAVLAVDPSSKKSKGSILGDKTRMEKLATNKNAFIRPSPTGTALGGVAAKTREVMLVCEAAGYNVILVETVGVGQSETAVKEMVDFFLLLMLPGAGDELQGIKKGIIEMADLVAVNKADGENLKRANMAKKQLKMALHMLPTHDSSYQTEVLTCSALEGIGMQSIWQNITDALEISKKSGNFDSIRQKQNIDWMHEFIKYDLTNAFYQSELIQSKIELIEQRVSNGELSSKQGSRILLELFGQLS